MNTVDNCNKIQFSPWIFVTHRCTCSCAYCNASFDDSCNKYPLDMTPEYLAYILQVCNAFISAKDYQHCHLRFAGGEPLLAFDLLEKLPPPTKDLTYGLLTNLTVLTDKMIVWLRNNGIGIQISLDDYNISKIDKAGNPTAPIVINNIQRLLSQGYYKFSVNTVLNVDTTDTLVPLFNYLYGIGLFHRNGTWGLNASYTQNDPSKIEKSVRVLDEVLTLAAAYGVDLVKNIRLFNVTDNRGGCSAGTAHSIAIGTALDVWPCQSMLNKPPVGKFTPKFEHELREKNDYFYRNRLSNNCSKCAVLEYCNGGCKAVYEDEDIMRVTCAIRKDVISKLQLGYYKYAARIIGAKHACGCDEGNHIFDVDKAQLSERDVITPLTECANANRLDT